MTAISVGQIFLEFGLDSTAYYRRLAEVQARTVQAAAAMEKQMRVRMQVDVAGANVGQIDQLQKRLTGFSAKVDDSALTALNKHIDIKIRHAAELQKALNFTVKTDSSSLNGLPAQQNNQTATQNVKASVDESALTGSIEKAFKDGLKGQGGGITDLISAPFKAISGTLNAVLTGTLEAIGKPIGDEFGKGLKQGVDREIGDIIGSFELVGRELGKGLAEDFTKTLSSEMPGVKALMGGLLGEENVALASAAQRGEQRKTAKEVRAQGSAQITSEYEFLQNNRGAIQEKAQSVIERSKFQSQKQAELQEKIEAQANKMGAGRLQERLEDLNVKRDEISQKIAPRPQLVEASGVRSFVKTENPEAKLAALAQLKQPELNSYQKQAVIAQLTRITENYKSVSQDIARIHREAAKAFQKEADDIAVFAEKTEQEERIVARLIAPAEQIKFVAPNKKSIEQQLAKQKAAVPQTYRQIAEMVAEQSGVAMSEAQLPLYKVNEQFKGSQGLYLPESNTIQVSAEVSKAIDAGKLTAEQVEILMHELRHAMQLLFGEIKGTAPKAAVELLNPTSEESRGLGAHIEGSVMSGSYFQPDSARKLETDAYLFASRNAAQVHKDLAKQQALAGLQSAVGVGGGKVDLNLARAQTGAGDVLQKFAGISPVDVSQELSASLQKIEGIKQLIDPFLVKVSQADLLGADEIVLLQKQVIKAVELSIAKIANETDAFKQVVLSKPEQVKQTLRDNLPTLNRKKQLEPLAREFGIDPTGLKKAELVESMASTGNLQGMSDRAMAMTRERAQQQLQRREQIHAAAEMAGRGARGVVSIGQNVASGLQAATQSPAAQSVLQAGKQSVAALGAVAKGGYALASGIEALTLDIIPMGRTLKSVGQQFVLPAATFTAATHMLPGGAAIAQGLDAFAQGGMAPLAHGAGEMMAGGAQGFLSHALPQAFGIQQTVTGAVSGALTEGFASGGAALASGMATVLGGKAIQAGVGRVGEAALKPLQIPLQLPAAREKELVALPAATAQPLKMMKAQAAINTAPAPMRSAAPLALPSAKSATDASKALASVQQSVNWGQIDEKDIAKIQSIGKYFATSYKGLKGAIEKGAEGALASAEVFIKSAASAQKDIDAILASMAEGGVDTEFASKLGGTLQGIKGQIAYKKNLVERKKQKMSPQEVGRTDVTTLDTSALNPEESGLYGFSGVDEIVRRMQQRARTKKRATQQARINAEQDPLAKGELISIRAGTSASQFEGAEQRIDNNASRVEGGTSETMVGRVKRIFAAQDTAGSFDWIKGLTGNVKGLMGAFVAFQAISMVATPLIQFTGQSFEAAKALGNLKTAMTFASGGSRQAATDLAFVDQTVSDLKIPLTASREGFKQLAASVKDTGVEGAGAKTVFTGMSQASTVLGLTADQSAGSMKALSDMASKGVVSMEELRGQLGDRIPGAMNIAARAMGMTTTELDKLVGSGQLKSEDFLPKFGRQLQAEFGGDAANASKNAQSAQFDFQNSQTRVQEKFGEIIEPAAIAGFQMLAGAAKLAEASLGQFDRIVTVVAAALATLPIATQLLSVQLGSMSGLWAAVGMAAKKALAGLPSLLASIPSMLGAVPGLLTSIGTRIAALAKAFAPMIAQFLVVNALIETGRSLFEQFMPDDLTKKANEFSDQTVAGLKKISEAADAAAGKMAKVAQPSDLKSKGFDLTFGIGEALGYSTKTDDVVKGLRGFVPGLGGMKTVAEKKFEENKLGYSEAAFKAQELAGASLGGSLVGGGSMAAQIAKVKAIDDQIKALDLQKQKAQLEPAPNKLAMESLNKQRRSLTQERDLQSAPIVEQSAQIDAAVKNIKKQLEEIDAAGFPADKAKELKDQLTPTLAVLEKAQQQQEKFNRKLSEAAIIAAQFGDHWQKSLDRLADADTSVDRGTQGEKTQLAKRAEAGAVTQGQSQLSGQSIDSAALNTKLANTVAALAKLQALFSSINGADTLKGAGISESAGLAELKTTGDKATDPKVKQAIGAASKMKELQAQQAQLEQQAAESAAQITQSMRDSTKQVQDFYRGIARQHEDLVAAVKASGLSTALTETKTKIQSALKGFNDTFIGEFASKIIELLELTNQMSQNSIDAQNKVMQQMRSLEDLRMQGSEMQRSMPGLDSGMAGGGVGVSGTASKVVDQALAMAGQDFAPGLLEQCANFVRDTLKKAGVDVGVTTKALDGLESGKALASSFFGNDIGEIIKDKSKVKPGDLLAFGGTYGGYSKDTITHVGVSVGDGQMVDRSTSAKPVSKRSIDTFEGQNSGFLYAVRPYAYGQSGQGQNGQPANNIMSTGRVSGGSMGGGAADFFGIKSEADKFRLAVVAITEGLSGNVQSQLDTAVAMGNRVQAGKWGSTASQVVSAPGQFEAWSRFGLQGVSDRGSAVQALNKNGYSGEQALNQFMQAMNNPQMVQASVAHVRGSTDYRGPAPNTRKEAGDYQRNNSDNFYIPGGANGASISVSEAQQIQQKGFAAIKGGGQILPSTGMAQGDLQRQQAMLNQGSANTSQINSGIQMAAGDFDTFKQSTLAELNARNAQLKQQVERDLKRVNKGLVRNVEDQSFEGVQRQRQVEDQQFNLGEATPEKQFQKDLIGIKRSREDFNRQTGRDLEKAQDTYDQATALFTSLQGGLASGAMPADIVKPALETLKGQLPKIKANLDQAAAQSKAMTAGFDAAEKDIRDKYKIIQEGNSIESAKRFLGADNELRTLQIGQANRSGNIDQAQQLSRTSQTEQINLDLRGQLFEVDMLARQQKITTEEADRLKKIYQEMSGIKLSNLTNELEKQRDAFAFGNLSSRFDSRKNLNQAKTTSYKMYGLDSQAKDLEKSQAIAQTNFDYVSQSRQIKEMADSGQIASGTAAELRKNLQDLNGIELDNIQRQFDPLTEVITQAKDAFSGFFSDIISGNKTIGDAFKDLLKGLGNQLAQMAGKKLTDALFGSLLGKGTKKSEGEAKDGFAGLGLSGKLGEDGGDPLTRSARMGGEQFKSLVVEAGYLFQQSVISGAGGGAGGLLASSQFGGTDGFLNSLLGGSVSDAGGLFSGFDVSGISDSLTSAAFDASNTLSFGIESASGFLSQAGTGASDNLLGGLEGGLGGVFDGLFGGGGGKGGGGLGSMLSGLFGGGGEGGGGGMGGIFGIGLKLLGPLLGFAEGGPVGDATMASSPLMSIATALEKERMASGGRKPVLATLHEGEYVLTPREAQHYQRVKPMIDNMRAFADGGSVGAPLPPIAQMSGGNQSSNNISIPITIQGGGSQPGIDVKRLHEQVRATVVREIQEQQRPGGAASGR